MKIRCGFVSNSSSSSFIIAYKPGQEKVKITIEADLNDFIRNKITNLPEGGISKLVETQNLDLIQDLLDDEILDSKLVEHYINDGYIVAEISASDEDGGVEQILCDNGLRCTNFTGKILFDESGGY